MAHRWSRLLIAQLASFTSWSCTAHPLAAPDPLPEQETPQYFDVNPNRDLDLLFMIDDSPSMKNKQALLAANTPVFMNVLQNIPGPDGKPSLPDVHVAVVSSDLGAGPTAVDQCRPGGDRGLFFGARQKPECGFTDPEARFIVSRNGGTANNFTGDISTVFGCLARLGDTGCGQEHQLQALRLALYDSVTPENRGFLRPDAYLGIVLLTDEDDCSAEPNTDLFTQSYPGFAPSWRCAHEGHLCGGKTPAAGDFSAPYDTCTTNDQGKLVPVQQIVDSIRALKRDPKKILVAAVTGVAPAGARYQYAKDPMQQDLVDYAQVCHGAAWGATGSLRIEKFVRSFGDNGSLHTICTDDFRPAMELIAKKLANLVGPLCLEVPPLDTDPGTAGVQPDCQVIERAPGGGATRETTLPRCGSAPPPCWKLVPDGGCPVGPRVAIDRGGKPAPTGAQLNVRCQTCPRPDDPRCKP